MLNYISKLNKGYIMKHFTEEDIQKFINVCMKSNSMSEAAAKLNMHFNTFKRYAIMFNCYNPNQSGKGIKKKRKDKILTEDILLGKYPSFQTYKLKKRLIDEHYIPDKCEICGWSEKIRGEKYTPCELHHIDGDRTNHMLSNLQLLCPNCHSLTDTHRARNIHS